MRLCVQKITHVFTTNHNDAEFAVRVSLRIIKFTEELSGEKLFLFRLFEQ